jgi:hypothetical protein
MSTQFQRYAAFKYCIRYTFLHFVLVLHVRLYVLMELLAHLLSTFVSVSWLTAHQAPGFMSLIL